MKLQNNFTTPEQSKRLLELGLPADSADCGIVDDIMHGGMEILQNPYSEWCKGYENISIPCWSVGRLMEIYDNCVVEPINGMWADYTDRTNYVEYIIACYKSSKLDFSKLED